MAEQPAAGLPRKILSVNESSASCTAGGLEYVNGKWWEVPVVCLLMLALAVCSTFPLIQYFDTGIPYAPFGGGKAWNRSGDQVQLMYWFWLVKENFMGAVPFNSNPFEFNMPIPHETSGLNTIPLAFLYMLFSPLGDVAAYNATIFSSYVLAGLFMYLLVREYSGSRTGALLAAIIFTLAPSRIKGFAAGHGYGFLFFCYPFILYYLEKGIRSRKIRYGIVSGIGLLGLAMLEPHLIYYICIFLGLYLPVRVFSLFPVSQDTGEVDAAQGVLSWSALRSLLMIWGAAIAVVLYSQFLFSCRDHDPFFNRFFWWVVGAYPLVLVLISLCFAAGYQHLSRLSFSQSLAVEAGSLLPLYLFLPLAWWSCEEEPVATGVVVTVALIAVAVAKIWLLRGFLWSMLRTLGTGIWEKRSSLLPILPLIFSMGAVVAWIASTKVNKIASTIAGGGRTLGDVGLFSASLSDLTTSTSAVYIGIVPAVLAAGLLLVMLCSALWGRQREKFATEQEFLRLFYSTVGFCCLLLALGLALGKSSLYILFYHYFPFFNYPRVSDRIITMVLFSLAIVAGFVVDSLQKKCKNKISLAAVTLLVLVAAGCQLKDYNVFKPMAINILDKGQDIYTYVKENIGDGLLLEIPLWPGDSHQSSLYQHYIMLDKVKRVNGCSPLVLTEYIKTTFEPLNSINQGRLGQEQYELLQQLRVKFITVHDNRDVFLKKVSPFEPLTTARRLKNSPYLEFVAIDNTMYFKTFEKRNNHLYLFRVKEQERVDVSKEAAWYDMPFFYDVNWRLHHQTGALVEDRDIGRWVFQATEGTDKPGFLVYGPYDIYPPGDYRCYFSISVNGAANGNLARIEVIKVINADDVPLVQAELQGQSGKSSYKKQYLDFSIVEDTKLEFRVFFYGKGQVRVEKIVVHEMNNDFPLFSLEAETMVGDTGELVLADGASNGKVIEARAGKSRKGDMVYGPNRIYGKGEYLAHFYLRLNQLETQKKSDIVAIISVTDGQGLHTYYSRPVTVGELNEQNFTGIKGDFNVSHDDELSFHVKFTGKASLQLDRIEVNSR
jgi:hypothetical protein